MARRWPVTLRHGPVTLRPLQRRDEAAWRESRLANATWTGPWDSTRPPQLPGAALTFGGLVAQLTREARSGTSLPWVIAYDDGGTRRPFAGQLTVSGITYGAACWAQAGYWVDHRVAGRGVAPLALALAADHLFGTLGLHRLEVAIRPENAKSLRVVEKLGFRYEGSRPAYMHVDGAWRDHLMFAVHCDEVGAGGLVGRLEGRETHG